MTASATFYTRGAEIAYQWQKCGTASASLPYQRSSSKEDVVALVRLQDVQKMNCSRTYFCPKCLARGAGELEAN